MILIGPCIPVQMAVDLSLEQIEEFRQATTKLSIGWLVGWLFGWLVGWLVGWLIAWLLGCLAGWLLGCLVARLLGCLVACLVA